MTHGDDEVASGGDSKKSRLARSAPPVTAAIDKSGRKKAIAGCNMTHEKRELVKGNAGKQAPTATPRAANTARRRVAGRGVGLELSCGYDVA